MENGDISLYDAEYTGVNLHGRKFSRVEAWMPTPDDSVRYESFMHHIRKFPFGAIGSEGNTAAVFVCLKTAVKTEKTLT